MGLFSVQKDKGLKVRSGLWAARLSSDARVLGKGAELDTRFFPHGNYEKQLQKKLNSLTR